MNDRDCDNCAHHSDGGCSVWECSFERKENDMIYRQDTIDAMEGVDWYHINKGGQLTHGANSKEDEPLYKAKDVYKVLNHMPSAQSTQTDTSNSLKALDCVERQAAIDAANDWLLDCLKIQKQDRSCGLIRRLEDLPSARPELRWIPCSPETMPKKTGYYLVQYTRKYCRKEMAVAFYSVEEARCDDDYTWEIETFSDIKEVIAWMPLPEPYAERRGK